LKLVFHVPKETAIAKLKYLCTTFGAADRKPSKFDSRRNLEEYARAATIYGRCRDVLSAVLAVEPSPRTEATYPGIMNNGRLG
jgi:hypothetical protein